MSDDDRGDPVIDKRAKAGAVFAVGLGALCLTLAIIWAAMQ